MELTVEFVSDLDMNSRKAVVGTLGAEMRDLHDAVRQARTILSDADFDPSVKGYRVVASGDQIIFLEQRGAFAIAAPLPVALQLSRWSLERFPPK